MTDIDRQDGESFNDFHHRATTDAALRERQNRIDRDDILIGKLRAKSHHLINVIDLSGSGDRSPHTGAYVIEYRHVLRGQEQECRFATIVDGKYDNQNLLNRQRAILHAIARQNGTADDRGAAALYAGRVLAVKEDD